jgi:hypothetical protein
VCTTIKTFVSKRADDRRDRGGSRGLPVGYYDILAGSSSGASSVTGKASNSSAGEATETVFLMRKLEYSPHFWALFLSESLFYIQLHLAGTC